MTKLATLCLLPCLIFAMVSCNGGTSLRQEMDMTKPHGILLHAVVSLGVTKLVHAHPEWGKPLIDAVHAVQQTVTPDGMVSMTGLIVFVKTYLPMDTLGSEYADIVTALTAILVDDGNAALSKKDIVVSEDIQASVHDVLAWIETAAILAQ